MKNVFARVLPAVLLLLSGCLSTVDIHARRVVNAASKGDLNAFRQELAPEALFMLGTEEKMRSIGAELAQYRHVTVGPALLVSRQRGDLGNGHIGDVRLDYRTTVAGASRSGAPRREIYEFLVRCENRYQPVHDGSVADTCPRNEGPPGIPCATGSPAYDSFAFVQSCAVADIAK